jgi:hypothetical protein
MPVKIYTWLEQPTTSLIAARIAGVEATYETIPFGKL